MKLIDCISGFAVLSALIAVFVPALLNSNNAYLADVKKIRAINDAYEATNIFYGKSPTETVPLIDSVQSYGRQGEFKIQDFKKHCTEKGTYYTLGFLLNGKEYVAYAGGLK